MYLYKSPPTLGGLTFHDHHLDADNRGTTSQVETLFGEVPSTRHENVGTKPKNLARRQCLDPLDPSHSEKHHGRTTNPALALQSERNQNHQTPPSPHGPASNFRAAMDQGNDTTKPEDKSTGQEHRGWSLCSAATRRRKTETRMQQCIFVSLCLVVDNAPSHYTRTALLLWLAFSSAMISAERAASHCLHPGTNGNRLLGGQISHVDHQLVEECRMRSFLGTAPTTTSLRRHSLEPIPPQIQHDVT
ncbi:hypothetical protein BDP67DRAFT_490688 [Colletotrichum lupini]|nr:hypothetical protein BDP67DRAFT_490688 [Colletotrichum lupini]